MKDMKAIEKILQSDALKFIEDEILSIDSFGYAEKDIYAMGHLLRARKELLDSVFELNDETLSLLNDFNERLTLELRSVYQKTVDAFNKTCAQYKDCTIKVEGRVYMSNRLPTLYPAQYGRNDTVWKALLDGSFQPLYKDGVNSNPILISNYGHSEPKSVNSVLFMNDMDSELYLQETDPTYSGEPTNNWNEHLDQELTKDMHLVYAFHNLWEHVGGFSIVDLIFVRDFETSIDIHIGQKNHKCS